MQPLLSPLRRRVATFEQDLRAAWSVGMPAIPAHLKDYRQHWLDHLQGELLGATEEELARAMRRASCLLVSDYHPSPRSRTGLAELIDLLPSEEALVLVHEFLPYGVQVSAQEVLDGRSPILVHGEPLDRSYGPVLKRLAARRAILVGAWSEGSPQGRDRNAAELVARIQRGSRARRVLLHFGDWHLAPQHLPAALAGHGIDSLCIHQSPEPIWDRVGLRTRERLLQMGERDWIWLQTPPLSHWANYCQEAASHPDDVTTTAEHLVESASPLWAQALELEDPSGRMRILSHAEWPEFVADLPPVHRSLFHPGSPPRCSLFHPRKAVMWAWNGLDLSDVMRAATHLLLREHRPQGPPSVSEHWRSSFVRHLSAFLVNPFLHARNADEWCAAFWPQAAEEERRAHLQDLEELSPHRVPWQGQPGAASDWLSSACHGQKLAEAWSRRPDLDLSEMRNFICTPSEDFDWHGVVATIRHA